MQRFFDQDLVALKQQILDMGVLVEKTIVLALQGLTERDAKYFAEVHQVERTINKFHVDIDQACLKLLARQSPMASDLRLVLAIIKINTDLERMGDQSVNIAHNGKHYISEPPLKALEDLPKMAIEVRAMVRQALDAFVRGDAAQAQKVVLLDDSIDAYKNKIFRDLTAIMKADPNSVERSLNLILVARNLERLGDHATNIAEDVIFIASGEDIRHSGKKHEMA
jgi:phosphate transport system protein